jgi:hypothetical protein
VDSNAPRPPTPRLSARVRQRAWWGSRVAVTRVAASTTSSRCRGLEAGTVARDGAPVAATPTAGRGTLSERGLVTSDVPSLSVLTGARAGVAGDVLSTGEKGRVSDHTIKSGTRKEERHSPQIVEATLGAPPQLLLAP